MIYIKKVESYKYLVYLSPFYGSGRQDRIRGTRLRMQCQRAALELLSMSRLVSPFHPQVQLMIKPSHFMRF